MTQPTQISRISDNSTPVRGDINTPPAAPAKPQPAAPLTDEQLRTRCVELAIQGKVDCRYLTASAQRIYDYIKSGTPSASTPEFGQGA